MNDNHLRKRARIVRPDGFFSNIEHYSGRMIVKLNFVVPIEACTRELYA